MTTTTTTVIQTITPEDAAEMLQLNEGNRPLRPTRVAAYAKMMAEGRWHMTGEPIIFNGTTLVNGQHRLAACVKSQSSFTTVVVRGVSDGAYAFIDSGLGRQAADVLRHDGHQSYTTVAAASRLTLAYLANDMTNIPKYSDRDVIRSFADDHREVLRRFAMVYWKPTGLNATAATAAGLILSLMDPVMAEEYMTPLIDGTGLESGDPRLALRAWSLANGRGKPADFHLAAHARAWNAYDRGEQLKYVRSWLRGQQFPTFAVPAHLREAAK